MCIFGACGIADAKFGCVKAEDPDSIDCECPDADPDVNPDPAEFDEPPLGAFTCTLPISCDGGGGGCPICVNASCGVCRGII